MRKFKGADPVHYAQGNQRAKLALMFLALFALAAAWIYSQTRADRAKREEIAEAPRIEATVQVPEVPAGTFDEVADATEEERVLLERSQLEVVKAVARQLTPGHFEQLDVPALNAELDLALAADPTARRGELVTARGRIEVLRERDSAPGRLPDWFGRLRTGDGTPAWFVGLRGAGAELSVGDWVRVDGMFFKRFAEEDASTGEWVTAPLIVSPRLVPSFEDFGAVDTLDVALVRGLRDDTLDERYGMPEIVKWRVLAAMRDMPEDELDWASAPELDGPTMVDLVASGEGYRGQPFLLPVSKMQGMKVVRTGENPAGLTHVTEAWIANQNWTKHEPLLHVLAPGKRPDIEIAGLVRGRIVYLRNMAYSTAQNTLRVVPVFAAYELEEFTPVNSPLIRYIVIGFIGLAALMGVVIFVLLQRDKRRSKALEQKLLERKRARRERGLAQA